MTPEEHRRLDAEVAEKVFRVKAWDGVSGWLMENPNRPTTWMFLPAYSSDIAAAMQIVEHFRERGWQITLSWDGPRFGAWVAELWNAADNRDGLGANAATLPEAICRAALQAVEARATDSNAR